jgi:hypothetical protein
MATPGRRKHKRSKPAARRRVTLKLDVALKQALDQQASTAEILKVIAASPSNTQPAFDAIARSAQRLFGAHYANVTRRVGDELHLAAHTASSPAADESLRKLFPAKLTGQGALGKAVLSGKPTWIADIETDPAYSAAFRAGARQRGYRSLLAVPMLRDGVSIGAIAVTRRDAGAFTEHQVRLLQTFADQAVIAIENARLFNETKESLERQTATADILKVISGSPGDVRPVFSAIVENAIRLSGGFSAAVTRVDGDALQLEAFTSINPAGDEALSKRFPIQLQSGNLPVIGVCRRHVDGRAHTPRGERHGTQARLSRHRACAHAARRQGDRADPRHSRCAGRIFEPSHRSAEGLRRPGGDRDPERAPVQRDERGARAADRDQRGAARHLGLARRRAAGARSGGRACGEDLRRRRCADLPAGR